MYTFFHSKARTTREEGIQSLVKLRDLLREDKHRLNEDEKVSKIMGMGGEIPTCFVMNGQKELHGKR
jgi:hypothetical protein